MSDSCNSPENANAPLRLKYFTYNKNFEALTRSWEEIAEAKVEEKNMKTSCRALVINEM